MKLSGVAKGANLINHLGILEPVRLVLEDHPCLEPNFIIQTVSHHR